jgi:hypothetical protein
MNRTPETIQQRREMLRCIDCERLMTRTEAEDRIIRTVIGIMQCGRKTRVEGKTFLCVAEWGHGGSHRYDVTVDR